LSRIEKNTKIPPSVQVTNNVPPVQVVISQQPEIAQRLRQLSDGQHEALRPRLSAVATFESTSKVITLRIVNTGQTPAENVKEMG
jgi:hypothetical protein